MHRFLRIFVAAYVLRKGLLLPLRRVNRTEHTFSKMKVLARLVTRPPQRPGATGWRASRHPRRLTLVKERGDTLLGFCALPCLHQPLDRGVDHLRGDRWAKAARQCL